MELSVRDRRCVSILLPAGTVLCAGAASLLIRCAQHHCGAQPWGKTCVELFCGSTGTLVLAHPAAVTEVHFAEYALPIVHNYFTD